MEREHEQTLAALGKALQVQKRAVRSYEIIANAAPTQRERELLLSIRREERRHYYLLEGIYEEVSGQAWQAGRLALSLPRRYQDMLKTALCDKLASIDFYEELRALLQCSKQQMLLDLILTEQKEQARILAALYDQY